MTTATKNWIEELKPGDDVIAHDRGYDVVKKVSRITKTQIILSHIAMSGSIIEQRYSRKNGFLIGGSAWSVACIQNATKERIEQVMTEKRKSNLTAWISKYYGTFTLADMEKMISALSPEDRARLKAPIGE